MLGGLIKSLRDFNQKSNDRTKQRIGDMKNSFKELSEVGKTKSLESESSAAISEAKSETISETTPTKNQNKLTESIRSSTEKMKEASSKRKAENAIKIEELRKKSDEGRLQMDRTDPGRKRTLQTLFIILAIGITIPLVIYDKWPASFFNRVEFIQNSTRGDLYIFLFTGMIIFLLLFPIQYYFLRRAAKRVVLNEEKENNKLEKSEYDQNENIEKNDVE